MRYTAKYLKGLPTICTGQAENLKVETAAKRVWLSRCTVDDGEPYNDRVRVERLRGGRWETDEEYPG